MSEEDHKVLVYKVDLLSSTISEMSSNMKTLSESMNRLVLAEERISNVVSTNLRIQQDMDSLDIRVRSLEVSESSNKRTVSTVDKFIWALAAASIIFVAVKTGLVG